MRTKIVGIRPGEKVHEEMITSSDGFNTVDLGRYFAILPSASDHSVESYCAEHNGPGPPRLCLQQRLEPALSDGCGAARADREKRPRLPGASAWFLMGGQEVTQDDINAVVAVLRSDFLAQGHATPGFEKAVAQSCGAEHAVAVDKRHLGAPYRLCGSWIGAGRLAVDEPVSSFSPRPIARFTAEPSRLRRH